MKKHLVVLLLLSLLILTFTLAPTVSAAPSTVYLSGTGSDSGSGTQASPYLTLGKALDAVSDGGTVQILDRVALTTGFDWAEHGKTVTITGGELDLTAFGVNGELHIRDDVTFTGIELTFATIDWTPEKDRNGSGKSASALNRTYVYANGHHVVIAPDVRFTNTYNTNVWLLGGSKGKTLNADTNLEVYAGTYTRIYGGGNGDTIKGDTHLTVGGTTNANVVTTNHNSNYLFFGGGWNGTITGNTYLTIKGSAKTINAHGGSSGAGKVSGYTNATLEGGDVMHLGGGGSDGDQRGLGSNVTVTGGKVQQVFGGNLKGDRGTQSNPVKVNVRILGGTVTRRIYGGCYNNYTLSGYSTANHVWGDIIVTLSADANITLNHSSGDNAIYARSRRSPVQTGEHGTVIFLGDAAYTKYGSLLGSKTDRYVMSGVTPADEQHTCTYTVSGGTVTETCSYAGCDHTATAAIKLDPAVSRVYSGRAIKPAYIEYSSGWKGEQTFDLAYANNVNIGTATASMSNYLAAASLPFTIEKAPSLHGAPALSKTDETVKGKADGRITGLTTAMEYSTNGTAYTAVTNPNMTFPAGTYYVRYAADAAHNASAAAELTINAGNPLTVTFVADGAVVAVRTVAHGAAVTDIPEIPAKTGYTDTPPYWNVRDLSSVTADMTVTAVYTENAPSEPKEDPPAAGTIEPAQPTKPAKPDEPATGDEANLYLLAAFLLLSGCGFAVLMTAGRKKQSR